MLVMSIRQIRSSSTADAELMSAVARRSNAYEALDNALSQAVASLGSPSKSPSQSNVATRDRIEKMLATWQADGHTAVSVVQQSEGVAETWLHIADSNPMSTQLRMESEAVGLKSRRKDRLRRQKRTLARPAVFASDPCVPA